MLRDVLHSWFQKNRKWRRLSGTNDQPFFPELQMYIAINYTINKYGM